jgi:opacity protein-like surface antigen
VLFFGTGGLAAANASLGTCYPDLAKVCDASGTGEDWIYGFAAGGGIEVAASDRVMLKFDALYYRLGPLEVNATGITPYTADFRPQGVLIRAGINVQLK